MNVGQSGSAARVSLWGEEGRLYLGLALLLGLGVYEAIELTGFIAGPDIAATANRSDYNVYYQAATRFLHDPARLYEKDVTLNLHGYTYPPLSVILFLPFALLPLETSFVAFQCVSLAFLVAAALIARRCVAPDASGNRSLRGRVFVALIVVSGPAYSTFVSGQVNAVLLAVCLGYVWFAQRQRHGLAGLLVAAGAWLKVYPAFLAAAHVWKKKEWRLLVSLAAFGLLLPMLMLPAVGLGNYRIYFLELLPSMAGSMTNHIYNQSITASLVRLELPAADWLSYAFHTPAAWIRHVNSAAAGLIVVMAGFMRRNDQTLHLTLLVLLAAIPLVAPLGWGHAYLLAVPLVAYRACYAPTLLGRTLGWICWLALLVPAYSQLGGIAERWPYFGKLFYFRYTLAVALTIVSCWLEAARPVTRRPS